MPARQQTPAGIFGIRPVCRDENQMTTEIDVFTFLDKAACRRIIDVRSPSEFAAGHLPGARNIPLFSDQDRAEVGIEYKRHGHRAAVLLGLSRIGPHMRDLAQQAIDVSGDADPLVHCWRGGMRSSSFSWLLETAGLHPQVLSGGYKAFRRAAQQAFAERRPIVVLSGYTGSGKTEMLASLQAAGEQVIDLEGIANHRGSTFGGIGRTQPTTEQFENELFLQLLATDPHRRVWLEDESPAIGTVRVPDALWLEMRNSPALFVDVPRPRRIELVVDQYGDSPRDALVQATERITRRLGEARKRTATEYIRLGQLDRATDLLLDYYDKAYLLAAEKRPRNCVRRIQIDDPLAPPTAQRLIDFAQQVETEFHAAPELAVNELISS